MKPSEQKAEVLLEQLGKGISEARARRIDHLKEERVLIKRKTHSVRKTSVILIAVCILLFGTTTICSEAFRAKVFEVVFDDQAGYSNVINSREERDTVEEKILYPAYIPRGFEKVQDEDSEIMRVLQYFNAAEGGELLIEQIKDRDMAYSLDTETSKKEKVLINGQQEGYYIYGEENHILIWEQDGIYMQITSTLDKRQLIKIADSMLQRR